MKSWYMHLIFGNLLAIFWITFLYFVKFQMSPPEIVLMVSAIMFTTLFPDVDLKVSKVRGMVAGLAAFIVSIAYVYFFKETWYYGIAYFLVLYFLIRLIPTKHRGIIHTVKFSVVFSIGVLVILNIFARLSNMENILWFAIIFSSYNLHLVLDRI